MKLELLAVLVVTSGLAAATAAPVGAVADQATNAEQSATQANKQPAAKAEAEPTEIKADSMEFDQKTGKALLSGNVHVTSGDMEVWADRMDVKMDATDKLEQLLARGNVMIKRGEGVAICGRAEYDAAKSKLVLTDSPVVREGKSMILRAPVFTYDQTAEKFVAEGGVIMKLLRDGDDDVILKKYKDRTGTAEKP